MASNTTLKDILSTIRDALLEQADRACCHTGLQHADFLRETSVVLGDAIKHMADSDNKPAFSRSIMPNGSYIVGNDMCLETTDAPYLGFEIGRPYCADGTPIQPFVMDIETARSLALWLIRSLPLVKPAQLKQRDVEGLHE
jgi:hypothetical protein